MKIEVKNSKGEKVHDFELDDGDYTFVVSTANTVEVKKPLLEQMRERSDWKVAIAAVFLTLLISLFEEIFYNFVERDIAVVVKSALGIGFALLGLSVLLSLLSRALTHRFQPWRSLAIVFMSLNLLIFLNQNLFGLRWWLPKIFWINEVYRLIIIAGALVVLWFISDLLLRNIRAKWRALGLLIFAGLFLLYSAVDYLPFRKRYKLLKVETPPPRVELLESSPVPLEEFLADITE